MHGSTFLLGPSNFNRRNVRKISFSASLSPFSLSLSVSLLLSCLLLLLSFFLFRFSLSYPPNFPSLVCSPSYFFFIFYFLFFFSFLSFSRLFLFLLSFPSFSLFYLSFLLSSIEWSKSRGNFPPLSSITTCLLHNVS